MVGHERVAADQPCTALVLLPTHGIQLALSWAYEWEKASRISRVESLQCGGAALILRVVYLLVRTLVLHRLLPQCP